MLYEGSPSCGGCLLEGRFELFGVLGAASTQLQRLDVAVEIEERLVSHVDKFYYPFAEIE